MRIIDDFVDVHGAEAVLRPVLHEPRAGVNHEDTLPGVGVLFVNDNDAGGDASALEEVEFCSH